jgi:hypothetical protein
MLYIPADTFLGRMVDTRAVNKPSAERFRGSRQKFKLWDHLVSVGTVPRRPAQARRMSVGVIG